MYLSPVLVISGPLSDIYILIRKVRLWVGIVAMAVFLLAYGFLFESFNAQDTDREIGIHGAVILFAWLVTVALGYSIIWSKQC